MLETLDETFEPIFDVHGWFGTLLFDPSPNQGGGLDLRRLPDPEVLTIDERHFRELAAEHHMRLLPADR